MANPAAVILAAGLSSRMGAFKPLLPIGEKSMIQRVVQTVRLAGANPILVVTGHKKAELEQHLENSGVQFVHNPCYAQTQMLDSVVLGLSQLSVETERVLLSPADLPLVRFETIQAILAAEGPFARPCRNGKSGHPIVLSHALLPALAGYRGPGGLSGAIRSMGISPTDVPVSDPGIHLNCNTPEEYDALLRYFHKQET